MPKKKKELIFKLMKVVDCQSMPDKVKKAFFESNRGTDNDCYVDWYIENLLKDDDLKDDEDYYGEDDKNNILISHWW